MSYVVIARRFRPTTFAAVVGQDVVTRTLTNALTMGRVAHAYLFSGTRGVGKTTTARLLAKCLNCEKGITAEPCNVCASCTDISSGSSLDVLEIDGASNRGINEIRELRESARYAPAGRHKVFIVDEVHMLTSEAWNALLKTLEEPPRHVVFILATTERDKVPATILSRCQKLDFRKLGTEEIGTALAATCQSMGVTIDAGALALLARAADGSVRDSQSLLEQVLAYAGNDVTDADVAAVLGNVPREMLREALAAILAGDAPATLAVVERLYNTGQDARLFTTSLLDQFRGLMLLVAGGSTPHLTSEERAELSALAQGRPLLELLRSAEVLARLDRELRQATMPRFALEVGLLELCEMRKLLPIEELIASLDGGSGPPATGRDGAPPRSTRGGGPGFRALPDAAATSGEPAPDAPLAPAASRPSPPPPPPAPAAPARPSLGPDADRFLEEARAELGLRAGFLDQVSRVEAGEASVAIHVAGGPAAKILCSPDVSALLGRVAERCFGLPVTIVAEAATEKQPAAPRVAPSRPVDKLRSGAPAPAGKKPAGGFNVEATARGTASPSARSDEPRLDASAVDGNPLVTKLLDIFQGDVTSVTPIDGSRRN